MFDPANIRSDFPLLQQTVNGYPIIYLDNAATSQKPSIVLESMETYYREYNANVHRGLYTMAEKATLAYEKAREKVAHFIGAEQDEVLFERSATGAINHIADLLVRNRLKAGDAILLTLSEHHSNLVPWQIMAQRYGFELKFIPLNEEGKLIIDNLDEMLEEVKAIAIQHVSNVTGVIHPVKEIIEKARARGIITLIDACQSIPHVPIDVKALDCDFLVFAGHKVYGPTGIGVWYGKKELLESFEPVRGGGDMILEVFEHHSTWNEVPAKFEAGTPAIAEAIGLGAAIDYIENLQLASILPHEQELTSYTISRLQEIPGVRILGPATNKNRLGAIAFVMEGIHPHDIAAYVDRYGIAIRAGHHCAQLLHKHFRIPASARISLGMYNTREDIDRAISALQEVRAKF